MSHSTIRSGRQLGPNPGAGQMRADENRQDLHALPSTQADARFLLLYLGRRGAMSRFTFEAMRAASALPGLQAVRRQDLPDSLI